MSDWMSEIMETHAQPTKLPKRFWSQMSCCPYVTFVACVRNALSYFHVFFTIFILLCHRAQSKQTT